VAHKIWERAYFHGARFVQDHGWADPKVGTQLVSIWASARIVAPKRAPPFERFVEDILYSVDRVSHIVRATAGSHPG
jgi:hypothetical protein